MKNAILAICATALAIAAPAHAGVNGTYRVRGSETDEGEKYSFTGNVVVSNYKTGAYSLKFNDGDKATYKFTFYKRLKESTTPQTVNAYNDIGTSTATFYQKDGKPWVKFTYKSKDGSVKGTGMGSK